jgi:hypothetical protein
MAAHSPIDCALLWSKFSMDPFTGNLYWREGPRIGKAAGCKRKDGYSIVFLKGKLYLQHRLVYAFCNGIDPGVLLVDHIDRNQRNNAIWNIRTVTPAQSSLNTKGLGIYKRKNGRYSANINKDYKRYYLGTFDTHDEAKAAYITAARLLHGEFACLE